MKEINEAYDQIQRQRKQQQQSYSGQASANRGYSNAGYSRQSYSGQGRSQFADIRQLLNSNRLSEAEELLEGIPQQRRDAEWYYLRGRVFYVHGWLDQAYSYYTRAVQMNPGNAEYQTALNQLMWQRNTGRPSGGYGDYRNVQSGGMSGCDMCSGSVSYTHLDVYKRQVIVLHSFDVRLLLSACRARLTYSISDKLPLSNEKAQKL